MEITKKKTVEKITIKKRVLRIKLCGTLFDSKCFHNNTFKNEFLTRREQEIPHLYRWWDELR